MQIVVARDALNPALMRATTAVPSSSPIAVVNCVMFVVGPDGCIVTATDLSAMFSETVDDVARENWSQCIDSARLLGFTKSMSPGSTLDLTADACALTIAGDGATAKLLTISAAEFPSFDMRTDAAPVTFDIEAAALATALKFTEPTASEDHILRPNLWGAFLDPDGLVVTTDTHRMATYRLTTSPPDFEGVILPLPIVRTLPGLLKGFVDTVTISVSSRLITFVAGKWRLTSKLVDGSFPAWRRAMPTRDGPPVIVETKALRAAVARVAAVCPDAKMKTSPVRLRMMTDNLVVSARTDVGDAEVESFVAVDSGPDDVSCMLSTRYFAEALAVIKADFVEIRMPAEPGPIWVCGADEPENGIVIFPVRW